MTQAEREQAIAKMRMATDALFEALDTLLYDEDIAKDDEIIVLLSDAADTARIVKDTLEEGGRV